MWTNAGKPSGNRSRLAVAEGGKAAISPDLLEEVTFLVEYPTALCGHIDDKYLRLPDCAIITPMRDHQRYFPMFDKDGKLMPKFITVRNGGKEHLDIVTHGNERVLRARLDDAVFFFDNDRKKSLAQHREGLHEVAFRHGLGNMYDKTERLQKLCDVLVKATGLEADAKAVERAALLSKGGSGHRHGDRIHRTPGHHGQGICSPGQRRGESGPGHRGTVHAPVCRR